ncbi:MAG: hypothetical protein E6K13_03080 [Methanobacteriota archaeon]|nr:MAG: hypothetical protein E6K13_03080 [Euryarchaeota archaeon]
MIASLREPWWRSVLFGLVLTLIFLATGVWQLTVVSAAVVGFLAGGGRKGAIRGIQATAPAWFLWLLVLSVIAPVEETLILLGSILGAGWGLVVVLLALVPIVLGLLGGMSGGYLAEVLAKDAPKPEPVTAADPPAR